MTANLPRLLKQDAIIESLLEIRLEHSQVGEVVLGRLASASEWKDYRSERLPFSELPQTVRDADANLRYQPILQLQNGNGTEVIKVGPRVISLHRLSGYPGWDNFHDRQSAMIDMILEVIPEVQIQRLGLRYINALLPSHGFKSFWDMNIRVEVGGEQPAETLAANYRFPAGSNCEVQVAVAHPSYVSGPLIPGSVALVDVDVFTPRPVGAATKEMLMQWLVSAHDSEKQAFFKLWPSRLLDDQRVD
jgi:uncharacterized protein (TIGR04255 family)